MSNTAEVVSTVVSGAHRALIHANGFVRIDEQIGEDEWLEYDSHEAGSVDGATAYVNGYFGLIDPDSSDIDAYRSGIHAFLGTHYEDARAIEEAAHDAIVTCARERSQYLRDKYAHPNGIQRHLTAGMRRNVRGFSLVGRYRAQAVLISARAYYRVIITDQKHLIATTPNWSDAMLNVRGAWETAYRLARRLAD